MFFYNILNFKDCTLLLKMLSIINYELSSFYNSSMIRKSIKDEVFKCIKLNETELGNFFNSTSKWKIFKINATSRKPIILDTNIS